MGSQVGMRELGKCGAARCLELTLGHGPVETPVFMPVGTQGTIKALTTEQLRNLGCQICLGNTYHLGERPGSENVARMGGLHKFMNWDHNILTDSGGFQMVSLLELAQITEEGVRFRSPHDGTESLLTPERSMMKQRQLGSDIIMALDDVVAPTSTPARIAEASERTVRWIDRCITAVNAPAPSEGVALPNPRQSLFAIIQGGVDTALRAQNLSQLSRRMTPGYAIGGLVGGEDKRDFWRTVAQCTPALPSYSPRYCMGVGYPDDMLVCVALGVDMFDCVWPTRTARFGTALVDLEAGGGECDLRHKRFRMDPTVLDPTCQCAACSGGISRGALHAMLAAGAGAAGDVGVELVTQHNVAYQLGLMRKARQAIKDGVFGKFVTSWMLTRYAGEANVPGWIKEALSYAGFPIS
eukprot:m51a1_g1240 putative queuine trna-ribosyltransferase (411) ;mRNA; f:553098-554557